ncbi:hypothetical protein BC829DRAFT_441481 [Chytridium lagenaria]|nr:hypothetical protein BC829DRAFT_441481 [Chytridium lagenaria]
MATLCFDLTVDLPYQTILEISRDLKFSSKVREYAWTFANEGLKPSLCLRFTKYEIAYACLYIACIFLGEHFDSVEVDKAFCKEYKIGLDVIEGAYSPVRRFLPV